MFWIIIKIEWFIKQYFIWQSSFMRIFQISVNWKNVSSIHLEKVIYNFPNFFNVFFVFVNVPHGLYVNMGCLECISGMDLSPTNKKLFILLFILFIPWYGKLLFFSFLNWFHIISILCNELNIHRNTWKLKQFLIGNKT